MCVFFIKIYGISMLNNILGIHFLKFTFYTTMHDTLIPFTLKIQLNSKYLYFQMLYMINNIRLQHTLRN